MLYALGVLHRWCCPRRQPAVTELNERPSEQQQPPYIPAPAAQPNTPVTAIVFQDSASEDSDTYTA